MMAAAKTGTAFVMMGQRQGELRELPLPVMTSDSGLLLVEASGVCGSDVKIYSRHLSPRILGHETVGTVARLGTQAAYAAVEWAVAVISAGQHPLERMCSLQVGLDGVDRAIRGTAGEGDQPVIHATVVPAGS